MLVFSQSHVSVFFALKANQCFTIPPALLTETQCDAAPVIRTIQCREVSAIPVLGSDRAAAGGPTARPGDHHLPPGTAACAPGPSHLSLAT